MSWDYAFAFLLLGAAFVIWILCMVAIFGKKV